MKKSALFFLIGLGGSMMLYSCKKCSTCSYKYMVGSVEETYYYPELCDKKKSIEEYETTCRTDADAVGGACTCITK